MYHQTLCTSKLNRPLNFKNAISFVFKSAIPGAFKTAIIEKYQARINIESELLEQKRNRLVYLPRLDRGNRLKLPQWSSLHPNSLKHH
jgi:hypothetical protein